MHLGGYMEKSGLITKTTQWLCLDSALSFIAYVNYCGFSSKTNVYIEKLNKTKQKNSECA